MASRDNFGAFAMADPFKSPKQLISHASDEIEAARGIVGQFINAQKYTPKVHTDLITGEQIYRIKVQGPSLPDKLSNIVKDAAGNLRDALDHAVYSGALVISGGTPTDTGFPFAKDAAGVIGELAGKRLAGNPVALRPVLAGFKPYEGGNDILWALNQIRNPNTHRFIVPVGAAHGMGSLFIGHAVFTSGTRIYSKWDPTTKEIEYMRLGRGSTANYQVDPAIAVVFEGINAMVGKPLIPSLDAMVAEVDNVVRAIEVAAAKIASGGSP